MIRKLLRSIDERVGVSPWASKALRHIFPDHWSFMLGEVAFYSFVLLVISGVYLTFFFDSGLTRTVYEGTYAPLRGLPMSAAYASVLRMSFDVRGGLLIRQIHHWAALIFLGSVALHAGRVFFTGAFRKPRDLNWMVGVTLLILALANGFLGYSLLDDLLSGIGLRIAYSLGESIPIIGPWAVSLAFGGEFPTDDYLRRFFILHVLVVPVLITALIGIHLTLVWRQKHTQFPAPGVDEHTVVGSKLFPTYAVKSLSLFFGLFAIVATLGGLAQINPVWLWGPYDSSAVTTAAQPDWYVGWLDGALRLFPPWEVRVGGFMVPNPFFPGLLMPGTFFFLLYSYPALERRFSGDRRSHELLDPPRLHPVRTGLGVAGFTYVAVLLVAGSEDVVAQQLNVSVQWMVVALRIAVVALPVGGGLLAWIWCRTLPRPAGPAPSDSTEGTESAAETSEVSSGSPGTR